MPKIRPTLNDLGMVGARGWKVIAGKLSKNKDSYIQQRTVSRF